MRDDARMPGVGDGRGPSLLRIPLARRLALASFVSTVGAAMSAVAIAFVAYKDSGSLVLTVLVLAARAMPALILSPIVGRLTGHDPRVVGAIGQSGKVAVALALAAVAAFGDLTYGVLLLANLANGTISALIAPTWPTFNRMVVPDDRLPEFTALQSGAAGAASIAGALVGGVVVATAGPAWTFLAHALSYVPLLAVVLMIPKGAHESSEQPHTLRAGIATVRRHAALRRALVLATILNLAAWPVLSALPALAQELDSNAHVLGYLTGAFFAGAAIVSWAVVRLRRRFSYGKILYAGFLGTGVLLLVHAGTTYWRDPGLDAVVTAALTLVPIGLAVSLNAALLQALVQLESPLDVEGPVLVVYATVTTIVAPLGGLLLGAAADLASLYWALVGCGLVLIAVAVCLHSRFSVFDAIGTDAGRPHPTSVGHHWALAHMMGPELLHAAHAHLHLSHRRSSSAEPADAIRLAR